MKRSFNTLFILHNKYIAVLFANETWSGWNKYAGIYTASEKDATHDDMSLILGRNTHIDARVIFDNVRMQPLPRNCDNIQNGDFELGDSSFWRQSWDKNKIEIVAVSNTGQYSMRYNQNDGNRWNYALQELDLRCFEEGQRFGKHFEFTNDEELHRISNIFLQ